MTDADELAERYLALWTQYLTALMANPQAMETLKRWMAVAGQFSYPAPGAAQPGGTPFPGWPPFFGPFAPPAATGAPTEREDRLADLAQRVEALEHRLTVLERRSEPPRPRRRARAARH